MTVRCGSCGTENPVNSEYCNGCGKRLAVRVEAHRTQRRFCPHCGASNPEYATFCLNCAKDFPSAAERPAEGRPCAWCGATVGTADRVCTRCGHDPSGFEPRGPPRGPEPQVNTYRPQLAGVLLFGSGVLDIMSGVRLLTAAVPYTDLPIDVTGLLQTCGALALLFGIIGLFGAVISITRTSFVLAMLAAALSMVGVGPFYLGSVLGLAGMIVIVMSREEFRR